MKIKPNNLLPKILRGSVHRQFKKCGKPSCKCTAGELHGPYFYHFVRVNGKLKKRYLRADEVQQVRAACSQRRRDEKQQRARSHAAWEKLREIRTELGEYRNYYQPLGD